MEKIKDNIKFSLKHPRIKQATEAALKKVSEKLIEETKKENGYLIISCKKLVKQKKFSRKIYN